MATAGEMVGIPRVEFLYKRTVPEIGRILPTYRKTRSRGWSPAGTFDGSNWFHMAGRWWDIEKGSSLWSATWGSGSDSASYTALETIFEGVINRLAKPAEIKDWVAAQVTLLKDYLVTFTKLYAEFCLQSYLQSFAAVECATNGNDSTPVNGAWSPDGWADCVRRLSQRNLMTFDFVEKLVYALIAPLKIGYGYPDGPMHDAYLMPCKPEASFGGNKDIMDLVKYLDTQREGLVHAKKLGIPFKEWDVKHTPLPISGTDPRHGIHRLMFIQNTMSLRARDGAGTGNILFTPDSIWSAGGTTPRVAWVPKDEATWRRPPDIWALQSLMDCSATTTGASSNTDGQFNIDDPSAYSANEATVFLFNRYSDGASNASVDNMVYYTPRAFFCYVDGNITGLSGASFAGESVTLYGPDVFYHDSSRSIALMREFAADYLASRASGIRGADRGRGRKR
jgi:hypothetical protein